MTEAQRPPVLELPKAEVRAYLAALENAVEQCPDDAALSARIEGVEGGARRLVRFLADGMALSFRPERAAGATGLVQLAVETDDGVAEIWLEIDESGCRTLPDGSDPDAVVRIPLPVLLRIAFKQLTGPDAYVDGRVTAAGDVVLAAAFDDWFEALTVVAAEAVS